MYIIEVTQDLTGRPGIYASEGSLLIHHNKMKTHNDPVEETLENSIYIKQR